MNNSRKRFKIMKIKRMRKKEAKLMSNCIISVFIIKNYNFNFYIKKMGNILTNKNLLPNDFYNEKIENFNKIGSTKNSFEQL